MDVEAEIGDLKDRVAKLEKSQDGLRTAFVKLVPLLEETRLRVSNVENDVAEIKQDVSALRRDVAGLRKDLPNIVSNSLRDVLKEQKDK